MSSSVRWEIAKLTYAKRQTIEALWFRGQEGLIAGGQDLDAFEPPAQNWTSEQLTAAKKAIILRKDEGADDPRLVFEGAGTILALSEVEGTFYALGYHMPGRNRHLTYLLRSTNGGRNFALVKTELPSSTHGIAFSTPLVGFAWGQRFEKVASMDVQVTVDGGCTWKTLRAGAPSHDFEVDPVLDGSGGLWVSEKASLVHLVPGKPTRTVAWPLADFAPECMSMAKDGILRVVGAARPSGEQKSEPVSLYQLVLDGNASSTYRDARFEYVSQVGSYLTSQIYAGEKALFVVATDMGKDEDDQPLGYLLVSADSGQTWTRETPPVQGTIEPIFFDSDGSVWSHATLGRFQYRR